LDDERKRVELLSPFHSRDGFCAAVDSGQIHAVQPVDLRTGGIELERAANPLIGPGEYGAPAKSHVGRIANAPLPFTF
jgi:hypothetical protein